jgi:hypothetical protein|tara:strand:- start:16721 stop:16927 length:207 start_codon:yes stop_codon:yes gene_type:complete
VEQDEITDYRQLVIMVQAEHDEQHVMRQIATALHVEIITEEQVKALAEMFYFSQSVRTQGNGKEEKQE